MLPMLGLISCNPQKVLFGEKDSPSNNESSISLTSSEKSVTASKRIPVSVTFAENVSDFTASDIVATGAAIQSFIGSGKRYSFILIPYSTKISIQILSGAVTFASGSKNSASSVLSFVSSSKFAPVYGGCYHPDFFRTKFLPRGF
jgi:hypothetical protein